MPVLPYSTPPDETALQAVRLLNSKINFRRIVQSLGLPIAAGGQAATAAELVAKLSEFLQNRQSAIVKPDLSGGGWGSTVIHADAAEPVAHQLTRALVGQPERCNGWVFEEFLPFDAVPSVQMLVTDEGPSELFGGDQRVEDLSWAGMVTPAADRPVQERLVKAAFMVGDWLHGYSYRGVFGLDCGLLGDSYVVTEANVRRTGATHVAELARRLGPPGGFGHWRCDTRRGRLDLSFETAVRRLDRAGLGDHNAPARVILTTDAHIQEGVWRYAVLGQDGECVAEAEQQLHELLGIRPRSAAGSR
ncbi:hypothetical protein GCM10010319_38710 [Streptomyces blastmyceticus]|uniref:ATP-grasp domain-containing protein n=2 Tax=Streptomyces blastmyceticus TaxID=68180 RepID=A0ABP3H0I6_9ACTN